MIKLAVVSDVRISREGLSKILDDLSLLEVVCEASNVKQAISQLQSNKIDIMLLDMCMIESDKVIEEIADKSYKTKLIVLSMDEDETDILNCAEAGISGYLSRDSSLDELMQAISQVHNGDVYCPSCITKHLLNGVKKQKSKPLINQSPTATTPELDESSLNVSGFETARVQSVGVQTTGVQTSRVDVLTRRERQVVSMMANGFSNKQIARDLTIEVSTVKNHVHSVLVKLDAKSRTQAVSMLQHSLSI